MRMEQHMQVTVTSTTGFTEEFADSTEAPGGGGGGGGTKLKRASSWKKFKDTVKGWVGQPGEQPQDQGVPSAVNPSKDVTRDAIL